MKTTFWNYILLCVTKVIVNKGHVTVMLEINTYVDEQIFLDADKKKIPTLSALFVCRIIFVRFTFEGGKN